MNEEKTIQRKALILTIALVLLVLLGLSGYYILHQQQTIQEIQEASELNKEMLQEQYNNLSLQYEEYTVQVKDDSLVAKLMSEKAKVRSLLEELKTVRATNAKRIGELQRELETLRKIMRNYVIQIDSLNAANQRLRTENQAQKEEISRVIQQATQLAQERTDLSKKVELAQKLSVSHLLVQGLNARGRVTKHISKMKQLQCSFDLDRNITAEPGIKKIYVRLYKPDDTLLIKPGQASFDFEGKQIPYSLTREVEYQGEPLPVVLYWNIDEFLPEGTYRVEIFSDGYIIGKGTFSL